MNHCVAWECTVENMKPAHPNIKFRDFQNISTLNDISCAVENHRHG